MHEYRRAFIGAVAEEGHNAGIVQIPASNMVADLHPDVSSSHASAELFACCVSILQGHLTKRFQPALSFGAKFKRRIVEQLRAIERVLHRPLIREQHRSSRDNL